jgi:hypothetical protein
MIQILKKQKRFFWNKDLDATLVKLKIIHITYTILEIANIFESQNPHLNLKVSQVKLHLEYVLRK